MTRTEEWHVDVAAWHAADARPAGLNAAADVAVRAEGSPNNRLTSASAIVSQNRLDNRRPAFGPPPVSAKSKIRDEGGRPPVIQLLEPHCTAAPVREVSAVPDSVGAAQPRSRTASETRLLALLLQRTPVPDLTKLEIRLRWSVGPDSVVKVLRAYGVDPGPQKGSLVPLTDVLLCEGLLDPLTVWAFASKEDRTILRAGLLTLNEWRTQDGRQNKRHAATSYRDLSSGKASSIRIGDLHRFRRNIVAAEDWLAERRLEVR